MLYNCTKYIGCIDSVLFSLGGKKWRSWNILILDSNNKDRQELREIIESADSDFIYEDNGGGKSTKAAQLLGERRIDIMLTEIFDSIETGTDIIGYAREKGVNPLYTYSDCKQTA